MSGSPAPAAFEHVFEGTIDNRIFLGDQIEFSLVSEALGRILARVPKSVAGAERDLNPDAPVRFGWRNDRALALPDA